MTPVFESDVDVRYRALVDVASALASHSELPDLLRSLRGHLSPLIPFSFLAVCLWDRERDTLTVRSTDAPGDIARDLVGRSFPMDGYGGQAIRTGKPVHLPRVRRDGSSSADLLLDKRVASFCAAPLTTVRGTIGVLAFGSLEPDTYSDDDVVLVKDRDGRVIGFERLNVLTAEERAEGVTIPVEVHIA